MDPAQLTQALSEVDPILWIAIGAVLLVLLLVAVLLTVRLHRRRQRLRDRYGAEYARTARRTGSRRRADQDLLAREEHRRSYEVRRLEAGERERFQARWEALQSSFVDGPQTALTGADELLAEVAAAKGYDASDGDPLRDVSVDHPLALDHYRAARSKASHGGDRSDTERLRRAMLGARDLFETLLGREHPEAASPSAAFSDLVDEDETPASERAHGHAAYDPDGPLAQGHSGEMPLYGPDGRPLGSDADQRRR